MRALRPNVTREEALRMLEGPLSPRVRSIAEVWIPFHLFETRIVNGASVTRELVAIDAVDGSLDLLLLDAIDDAGGVEDGSRNQLPARLEADRATALMIEKLRRAIFVRGFFRVRALAIEPRFAGTILVPYWAAFHGRDDDARLRVIDAVRRRREGGKVRRLVADWLAA